MVALDLLAIALFFVAASAWRRRWRLSSSVGFLAGAVCLLLALLCGAITVGVRGYRALTQEVIAVNDKITILVNGKKTPRRFLRNGDIITLGMTELKFEATVSSGDDEDEEAADED